MRAFSRALLWLSVAAASLKETTASPIIAKVTRTIVTRRGWAKRGIPPPHHLITLHIGLPQANFHVLERHLYEVSDPAHARYGAHLSREEVQALVAPREETIRAVDAWLASHGIEDGAVRRSPAGDWVMLTVSVSTTSCKST